MIQESKLNNTFPDEQFTVKGFRLYRYDYMDNSGGIMLYVRSDLPQRERTELMFNTQTIQSGRIESVVVEIVINGTKWLLYNVYKQPKVTNSDFKTCMENILSKCMSEKLKFIICGDMNINMLQTNNCLSDLFDIYGVTNTVKSATCFKARIPTMVDLVVTNAPKCLQNTCCVECDLSDFHKMVCFSTKSKVPVKKKRTIMYRSYRKFEKNAYVHDLSTAPYHVGEVFDDVDDAYWYFETLTKQIIDENAPLKKKVIRNNSVPYMNGALRKAINVKNMYRRKFYKHKSSATWEVYRVHRNKVTKQRRQSMKEYLRQKCDKACGGKDFWKSIKPLVSNKSNNANNDILLVENDVIITNTLDVSTAINDYYVNITQTIGYDDYISENDCFNDIISAHVNNNSVLYIKDKIASSKPTFEFTHVVPEYIFDVLSKLNARKATGVDNIPSKLLKCGAGTICHPITYLFNKCVTDKVFPNALKSAEVSPILKKGDVMNKKNYRPVSVLPCVSKVFEKIMIEQMSVFLSPMLSSHLSGFRKGHSCQSVLLNFVEKCRSNLDNKGISGALLTDLSKAFDCLSYKLIVSKLHAYGFNESACMFIANYFTNRQQCVRIGDTRSHWLNLKKGAPQGSLMGPFIYNVLSNDLLYLMSESCEIYNYADDSTICVHGKSMSDIATNIETASKIMFNWFYENNLKPNPDKCQFILFSNDVLHTTVTIDNTVLHSLESVKLLGVHIDRELNFNCHVSELCRRAGRQLSALGRLTNVLNERDKMVLFECFILSHFYYCPVVWQSCSLTDMKKIEHIQKRALRYVFNDQLSSYTELRTKGNKSLLYVQRLRMILVEVYKIANKQGAEYLHVMVTPNNSPYDMRNNNKFVMPNFKTIKYGKMSFAYIAAKLWNGLNNDVKNAKNVNEFKKFIKEWQGPACTCSTCTLCSLSHM